MAHHRSARKRIRQTAKRTVVNRSRTGRIKTFVRKVEDAVAQGNYDAARVALAAAEPEIRRGVTQGRPASQHRLAASISRLARRVNALRAAPASRLGGGCPPPSRAPLPAKHGDGAVGAVLRLSHSQLIRSTHQLQIENRRSPFDPLASRDWRYYAPLLRRSHVGAAFRPKINRPSAHEALARCVNTLCRPVHV